MSIFCAGTLASFPGPAQLFIACSTEKHGESGVQGVAMVIEEVVELDPTTETVEIITYSTKTSVYSPDKAIERARTKIGEQAYHLFNNNCESFVNWALTGEAESKQGDFAKIALAGAGLAVVFGVGAAVTVGVLRALSGKKK